LKLQHDQPLANSAFNFNLRRYSWGRDLNGETTPPSTTTAYSAISAGSSKAVQVDSIKTRVESAYGFSA